MEGYKLGFNLLKQCLFGIGFNYPSISICMGCFSIEIHFGNMRNGAKWFSGYNEWRDQP